MSKYPFIQQHDEKDCGAACLSMISEYYGLKLPIAKFREFIKVDNQGVFFASPFWTKLQNIFGHCCMSKLDKVAKHMASLEQTSRTALQTL